MNEKSDIRQGFCPQCGHDEVIESAQSEFTHANQTRPMCVTYDARWIFPGQNPAYGHGQLFLYVCRACGFCQWYARNPGGIPISDGHRTRLIQGERPETGIQTL